MFSKTKKKKKNQQKLSLKEKFVPPEGLLGQCPEGKKSKKEHRMFTSSLMKTSENKVKATWF